MTSGIFILGRASLSPTAHELAAQLPGVLSPRSIKVLHTRAGVGERLWAAWADNNVGIAAWTGKPDGTGGSRRTAGSATFVAAYGDCGFRGCDSSIGTVWAVPYTSDDDTYTTRATSWRLLASSTFSVPSTFANTYSRGCF